MTTGVHRQTVVIETNGDHLREEGLKLPGKATELRKIFSSILAKSKSFWSFENRRIWKMKYFSLGQQRILLILTLVILGVLYFRFYYHPHLIPSEKIFREFVVEVMGEVPNPGIYVFKNPPTLKEAIEKAGGLREAALFDTPSSTEALETGTLIAVAKESRIIPPSPSFYEGEYREIKVKLGRMPANKLLVFSIPLDLNRVSVKDLCLVPEIGQSLAQEIVAYRERRKGFRSVEELKNVKGIGEKKWNDFKKFFRVR
jgi:competence ComEA-like helix-hairpin-helix protein